MRLRLTFLLLIISLFASCSKFRNQDYTLQEKVGQLILIGFRGLELDENPQFLEQIKTCHPGGIILYDYDVPNSQFQRNIESPQQVQNLVEELQSASHLPLFIAIDQEGGKVVRLKEKMGFQASVSAQYLGDLDQLDSTQYYASAYAKQLKDLGINMNFAPVVDVNVNPNCPIIGKIERSFSADPAIVAKHAAIFINTYRENGIVSSLKHYPGHGSSQNDSHLGFTDVSSTWQEIELEPYKILIDSGLVDMVMTAHVFNEFWDARYPATLSDNMIRKHLRNQLGYQGIVISDDMCMGAIEQNYSLKNSIELALRADVDLFIFSNNGKTYDPDLLPKVTQIIIDLVKEGKVSEERINSSFNRVIQLKNQYRF